MPYVEESVNNFLQKQRLGTAELTKFLEMTVTTVLQKTSEQYARELLAPLSVPLKERLPKPQEIENTLKEILNTLGNNKRGDSVSISILEPVTRVGQALGDAIDRLTQTVSSSLKSIIFHLVDKPNDRLGLADEAINLANNLFDQRERQHQQLAAQQQEERLRRSLECAQERTARI